VVPEAATTSIASCGSCSVNGSPFRPRDGLNSMAQAIINTYKHELLRNPHVIRDGRRWRTLDDLYLATVAWVGWYNHDRLHSALHDRSPRSRR